MTKHFQLSNLRKELSKLAEESVSALPLVLASTTNPTDAQRCVRSTLKQLDMGDIKTRFYTTYTVCGDKIIRLLVVEKLDEI